jgi:formylglycine-generating enzyme required for sulfatase activity
MVVDGRRASSPARTRRRTLAGRFSLKVEMPTTRYPPRAWTHPLERGIPPTWASEWGEDRLHGPWCAFEVKDVVQRLRWIPPGVFWMGSPEDEEGRFADEGPRHLVSIDSGFWTFDTPCTQALWEAVMGENLSEFKGADRPVESVSWQQCQEFLTELNSRLEGLELSLPSEAQWEYACRAGTETARYSENLDAIAWYGENSGNETHFVAGKEANSWGLYDMLGNVFEWCADVWVKGYTEKARAAVAESASAHRVVRGGSWRSGARYVRAAYRNGDEPSIRLNSLLGFRCAEFRAGSRAE